MGGFRVISHRKLPLLTLWHITRLKIAGDRLKHGNEFWKFDLRSNELKPELFVSCVSLTLRDCFAASGARHNNEIRLRRHFKGSFVEINYWCSFGSSLCLSQHDKMTQSRPLSRSKFKVFDWACQSLDLNPNENLWQEFEVKVNTRKPKKLQ